jgi:hypothetical protein
MPEYVGDAMHADLPFGESVIGMFCDVDPRTQFRAEEGMAQARSPSHTLCEAGSVALPDQWL